MFGVCEVPRKRSKILLRNDLLVVFSFDGGVLFCFRSRLFFSSGLWWGFGILWGPREDPPGGSAPSSLLPLRVRCVVVVCVCMGTVVCVVRKATIFVCQDCQPSVSPFFLVCVWSQIVTAKHSY